jgi:NAD(P)-dependent dehydrogenase (short-subunit alcohol dehydrogenase family)
MEQFKGKTAVVTGGNSGIGYAAAKELAAQGATVIITGRRKEAVAQAAAELGVTGVVSDQGRLGDIDRLVSEVTGKYGKVDILFINAGIGVFGAIEHITEEQFDNVMNVNFKGAYFTLSRFIPHLSDGASVILLSSNSATMSLANGSVYSASKSALNRLAKIAAVELAPRGIRVNAISPGPTETNIMDKFGIEENMLKEIKASMVNRIPLRKMGSAENVAKWVVQLSGDAGSFVTGAELVMDGGMML